MMKSRLAVLVASLLLLVGSSSIAVGSNHKNAVEFLVGQGNFTTLVDLVVQAGLDEILATGGPFTIFAPTDDAFADLAANNPDIFDAVTSDPDLLTQVLLYHVSEGSHLIHQLVASSSVATLNGAPVIVYRSHRNTFVNDAQSERGNYRASNAVIHAIGKVLVPPQEGFQFESVMDVLRFDSRFTTLVSLLEDRALDTVLESAAGVTIYAPTNEAFEALQASDPDLFDAVLADPNLLTQVLVYHVTPIPRSMTWLLNQKMVPTLQGASVMASCGEAQILVNSAPVNSPDISAPNGFVHALDAVLVPPVQ